jgi:hypothetical protein
MQQHLPDSILAMASGTAVGTYVAHTSPGANPWMTQILMPFLGAVLVPFLKELSIIGIKYFKQKLATRKNK